VLAVTDTLKGRDFTRVRTWSGDELVACLDLADGLKRAQREHEEHRLLPGRTLGMLFEKPSLRTRVSFAVGIHQLGGLGIQLAREELQLGERETLRDAALVLSRYLDGLMVRTFSQDVVEQLAKHATIPVINGLTDETHPCQALADVMTIRERFGRIEGIRVAYIGDGNNVCTSLSAACNALGAEFVAATPYGYEPADEAADVVHEPAEAARDADVLYTDVWTSMGRDDERERRLRDFAGFTIDERLVELAADDAIVLHCLPAHYGEEIAEAVLYGPRSAVFDQAENRLHAQKALMALVIE
jgi:ornithine carbamoyltransferase